MNLHPASVGVRNLDKSALPSTHDSTLTANNIPIRTRYTLGPRALSEPATCTQQHLPSINFFVRAIEFMALDLAVATLDGLPVLALSGKLDILGASTLDDWAAKQAKVPVVWDIGQLSFISSAGIRSLMKLDRVIRSSGQRPQVCGLHPMIRDVLTATGLIKHWDFHENRTAAVTAAGHAGSGPLGTHTTAAGRIYSHQTGNAPLRVTLFQSTESGTLMPISFAELGNCIGSGGFGANAVQASEIAGPICGTGETLIVQTPEGASDFLRTVEPGRTFAFVDWAMRFDGEGTHALEPQAPLTFGALQQDLLEFAQKANANSWVSSISCEVTGKQVLLIGWQLPTRCGWLALHGDEPSAGIQPNTPSSAFAALNSAVQPDIIHLPADAQLSRCRVWLEYAPVIKNGAEQRLSIDVEENLPADWELIIRAIFANESRVKLKRLTGGFVASTFAAESYDQQQRRMLPTVLKLAPYEITRREEQAYLNAVRPFILNNSTVLFGKAAHGDYAGLRYNFVGIAGTNGKLQSLEAIYRSNDFDQALSIVEQTLTDILNPWYGQAKLSQVQPFHDHDMRAFFPTLPDNAESLLGIDPDRQFLSIEAIDRDVLNPYWFIKHRLDQVFDFTQQWHVSITHGDLNFNNILVDEKLNVYLIDFSETKARSVASDFARIEAIGMFQHTRIQNPDDETRILRVVDQMLKTNVYTPNETASHTGDDDLLTRALHLTTKVRSLAGKRVASHLDEAAYLLPLFQWVVPIVAFSNADQRQKRVAAYSAGMILERALAQMGVPLN